LNFILDKIKNYPEILIITDDILLLKCFIDERGRIESRAFVPLKQ
jgi:ribosomal protein S18